jgi:oligopeptide transport system ATP-binding protein
MSAVPLLSVSDLHVDFKVKSTSSLPWSKPAALRAVNGVSFDLFPGETLGLVGESGCGKSTLARAVLNLVPATSGSVKWFGQEMVGAGHDAWQQVRKQVQVVFQDPLASLNPRMNIAQIVGEPLRTHEPGLPAAEVLARVKAMLQRVGLNDTHLYRYPHEFSGGQCQRIGIARALILRPRVLVCDEPLSALDVSIQAQIVNLLQDLQREMGLALLFIAHDLAVVKHVSQRVLVMYLGRTMELGEKQALYGAPKHPYTQALQAAVPVPDPRTERHKHLQLLKGDIPSPIAPPSGCVFRTRCPHAFDRCAAEIPPLKTVAAGDEAACWLY